MSKHKKNHRKEKKNDPDYGNGPLGAPVEEDGNKERKNITKRRGRPKPKPKDIFDMDPQPKPKKSVSSGPFDDIISAEYLQWLEHTAKQAGYNTTAARAYFDGDRREHPEEDFRQCAAEWYDDVKYTFGFDVGWFDMQRRWC